MPIVAVVNRKGGSGKSTLATHLAAASALAGRRVMLGDVDRQQSAQAWLRLRAARKLAPEAAIAGWAIDPKNVLRVPAGITHVVLDTPGGMRGFELARIVMNADAILMPVCNSVFDRDSAAECYEELKSLPRVASGRCKVAAIGMRLDARTRAAHVLEQWAGKLGLPFVGIVREAQIYVRCAEHGLTVFDLPAAQVDADLAQWRPILGWLDPILDQAAAPATASRPVPAAAVPDVPVVPDSLLRRPPSTLTQRAAPEPLSGARPRAEVASARSLAPRLPVPVPVPSIAQSPRPAPASRPAPMNGKAAAPDKSEAATALAGAGGKLVAATTSPTPRPEAPHRPPVPAGRQPVQRGTVESRLGKLLEALPIPRFLQRNS